MLNANYTSENICHAIGLDGFANDWQLAGAEQAIRALLTPSFHREVCISFLCKGAQASVSVVAADSQIWAQDWPVPLATPHERQDGILSKEVFLALKELLLAAAKPKTAPGFVVIDGMQAHSVLRCEREGKVNLSQNVSYDSTYGAFVAKAISVARDAIESPNLRNALRDAGTYVGLVLPKEHVPAKKPMVRTIVLGTDEEASQLLESLKKQHGG